MASRKELIELLKESRLVAILRLDDLSQAISISQALLRGGIRLQEYTLSNPAALEAIGQVRASIPEFAAGEALLGVGSVRDMQQAEASAKAGVDFVVTPTMNASIIRFCEAAGTPVVSGAFSPTEIATAWELGSCIVKVFPARMLGPTYIRDILAPMPDLQLMPTGGISLENIEDYFSAGAAAVGVGGSLIDSAAIEVGDWDRVTETARKYADRCAVV